MMSKKHYEKFAEAISKLQYNVDKETIAHAMIPVFKEDNPRFDETRFLKACEIDPLVD